MTSRRSACIDRARNKRALIDGRRQNVQAAALTFRHQAKVTMNTPTGYSRLQIALHWFVAVLILVAWLTGEGAEEAMDLVEEGGTVAFVPHVAIGLAILTLVAIRLLVRLGRGAPAAPGVPGSLAVKAAEWGHRALYLLMIAVPLGGISTWFLGLDVGEIHGLAANVLMIAALGHAAMALYHQYIVKDGLLRRMMRAE
jgi:cytochrome b561